MAPLPIPVPGVYYSTLVTVAHWFQKPYMSVPPAVEAAYRGLVCTYSHTVVGVVVFSGSKEDEEENAGSGGRWSAWVHILASLTY